MRLLTRRPKRAAQAHVDHALVEVTKLLRVTTTMWSAHVTYTHGLSTWSERVHFSILASSESTLTVIVITDGDFPRDRERRVTVPDTVDVEQFVLDYLIAGRW